MRWLLPMTALLACYPQSRFGETPLYLGTRDFPYDIGPFLVQIESGSLAVIIEHPLPAAPTVTWSTVATGTVTAGPSHTVTAVLENDIWIAEMKGLPIGPKLQYVVQS
ncbi:MAG: hypothetical protein AAFV29_03390, partial [Myxococcota bacterium]